MASPEAGAPRSNPLTVAVNGRFVTQQVTGVQRYAHELVTKLASTEGARVVMLVPPDEMALLEPGQHTPHQLDPRWWGAAGHRWEQTVLRRLFRRSGASVLLSPCNWGPLTLRPQLPVIHDLYPLLRPAYFDRGYVRWARLATPLLVRVTRRVGVTSHAVREQLVSRLRVDPARIDVVPPAVGPPFTEHPLGDLSSPPADYCLFVGGDKAQKNLAFLLEFWPEVHQRLGLELRVTERAVASRMAAEIGNVAGVVRVSDPSDEELVDLYAGALCLLWPSLAEGFGIPLLEAMAVGTPFLSADVGAARELAVVPEQVLPLDPARWVAQLEAWRSSDQSELRSMCAERARRATWERSARAMTTALQRCL